MITRVGDDRRGRIVLDRVRQLGVEDRFVQIDPDHPTGTVDVTLTADGQPDYVINEGVAYDYIEADDPLLAALSGERYDVFCFGTLIQRTETNRQTLARIFDVLQTGEVLYDVNLRKKCFTREWVDDSLSHATICKLNDDEAARLANLLYDRPMPEEAFAAAVQSDYPVKSVCVTRGADGCTVYHAGARDDCPGVKITVADAVGAGDAFSAAFACKYCRGASPAEAARFANQIGAFVASQTGAIPEYSEALKREL